MMFCIKRLAENEFVLKKAREVWPKVVIVVEYWKPLSESKQPGRCKRGQNTSVEHLSTWTK